VKVNIEGGDMDEDVLDNSIEALETSEAKERGETLKAAGVPVRTPIGTVEGYYDRINVVAISLIGKLSIGDIIEIGEIDDAVRQRVSSMQIDREDVLEADNGDSVGVKLKYRVDEGRSVYRMD
jgi:translation elongation factor EF-1alpha